MSTLPENFEKYKSDQTAAEVISYQANLIEQELIPHLPRGTKYALVDFPNHSNVGDSAIWLGEIAMLTKLSGARPRYVCDYDNFDTEELRQHHPDGPILIHGGGNFGDIWPNHHQFREKIFSSFPDRKIIQLPQTISFKDSAKADHSARLIEQHGRVTLFVRDRVSEAYAKANLPCQVKLLPDMAFGIGLLKPRTSSSGLDAFILLRQDSERGQYDSNLLADIPNSRVADWLDEPESLRKTCELKTRLNSWGRRGGTMEKGRLNLFMHLAQARLERGLAMLSSGRVVITDRLHAHILSTLLDKPHVVMDNNYGKIFSYMDAWTHPYKSVRKAYSSEEAVAQYQKLLEK